MSFVSSTSVVAGRDVLPSSDAGSMEGGVVGTPEVTKKISEIFKI
jgi:hypothetical protein